MAWSIEGRVAQFDPSDGDGSVFRYAVTRGSERRSVDVVITQNARKTFKEFPRVGPAVETSGESALADVLEEVGDGDPPKRIVVLWTRIEVEP
jgi:hypothetical protein